MIFVGDSKVQYSEEERWQLEKQHWTLRTRRWRYIHYNDGVEELYDHENDPREWTNLASSPEHTAIRESLKKQMFERIGPVKKVSAAAADETRTKTNSKWDWFGTIDDDKDEKVTETEWVTWAQGSAKKKERVSNEKKSRAKFARRDTSGDGIMSRKELEAGNK
jgi:hypothetical protein